MNRTGIEYLDFSWNPMAMRCTPISEGCANCWHQRMADRLKGNKNLPFDVRRAYAGEGPPVLVEERLMKPLRRKKAARIGTQFMGDLFHENVPLEHIGQIFDLMMDSWIPETPHTYLLLTKRPKRMLMFLEHYWCREVPNFIWLGVSVENQEAANERREYLRQTPAAIKYVSYEPTLNPVDWIGWEFVDQIISGGESGPGARPSHPNWHRATRDFCQKHGIAYFFKQWGEWQLAPIATHADPELSERTKAFAHKRMYRFPDGTWMAQVGKKRAGRLLDGVLWEEYPV